MEDEEDVTAHLLRLGGAPPDPPAARGARVRQAVHDAWQAQHQRRIRRRRLAAMVAGGLCGVAALIAMAVRLDRAQPIPTSTLEAELAIGTRVQGQPIVVHQAGQPGVVLNAAMSIHAGDVVQTDDASRASLRMSDGSTLLIDRQSRVRFDSRSAVELVTGIVYFETAEGSRGFEIRTPMGDVRDVGTKFEVRLVGSSLRVRVRAGRVQLQRGSAVSAAEAGTETTVTAAGLTTVQVPSYGADWEWVAALAVPFPMEGHTLREFLEHTAAEQGWILRYASPAVAATADRTVLHGSVEGLSPEQALAVALATSGLTHRLHDGELLVSGPEHMR
jgi:ferric-dicitrate binding protein FerR (iron transport regulator)